MGKCMEVWEVEINIKNTEARYLLFADDCRWWSYLAGSPLTQSSSINFGKLEINKGC